MSQHCFTLSNQFRNLSFYNYYFCILLFPIYPHLPYLITVTTVIYTDQSTLKRPCGESLWSRTCVFPVQCLTQRHPFQQTFVHSLMALPRAWECLRIKSKYLKWYKHQRGRASHWSGFEDTEVKSCNWPRKLASECPVMLSIWWAMGYPFQELLKPLGPSRCHLTLSNSGEETSRNTVISPWPPGKWSTWPGFVFPISWFRMIQLAWSSSGTLSARTLVSCLMAWGLAAKSPWQPGFLASGFSLSSSGCEIKRSLCSLGSFQCLPHFTCMDSAGFWQVTLCMKPQLKAVSNEALTGSLWEWKRSR